MVAGINLNHCFHRNCFNQIFLYVQSFFLKTSDCSHLQTPQLKQDSVACQWSAPSVTRCSSGLMYVEQATHTCIVTISLVLSPILSGASPVCRERYANLHYNVVPDIRIVLIRLGQFWDIMCKYTLHLSYYIRNILPQ